MAFVTAQKRQTLRLPTPDAAVDSIDQLALLGIWQVETSADALSTNQKRWILRLPIVDAAVDELDAWGFLQLPQTANVGVVTDSFSLSWAIDPTYSFSVPLDSGSGAISATLENFGVNLNAAHNVFSFIGRTYSVRFNDEIYK